MLNEEPVVCRKVEMPTKWLALPHHEIGTCSGLGRALREFSHASVLHDILKAGWPEVNLPFDARVAWKGTSRRSVGVVNAIADASGRFGKR